MLCEIRLKLASMTNCLRSPRRKAQAQDREKETETLLPVAVCGLVHDSFSLKI